MCQIPSSKEGQTELCKFPKILYAPGINLHCFVKNRCFNSICDKLGKTEDLQKSFYPVLYDKLSESALCTMNDAIIWWVYRSVSGHIQRSFFPDSDHAC